MAGVLADPRRQASCDHRLRDMLRQRVFDLALRYEDLNDHDALRHYLAWQTALDRDQELASAPTLCRFENRADRESLERLVTAILVEIDEQWSTAIKAYLKWENQIEHGNQKSIRQIA